MGVHTRTMPGVTTTPGASGVNGSKLKINFRGAAHKDRATPKSAAACILASGKIITLPRPQPPPSPRPHPRPGPIRPGPPPGVPTPPPTPRRPANNHQALDKKHFVYGECAAIVTFPNPRPPPSPRPQPRPGPRPGPVNPGPPPGVPTPPPTPRRPVTATRRACVAAVEDHGESRSS